MESKLVKGAIFSALVMENRVIKQRYYKILSVRNGKETFDYGILKATLKYPQGFTVKEMQYKIVSTELMAVDEESKNTKLVDHYTLKETNEKPKYFKYNIMDFKTGVNQILKPNISGLICKSEDRFV